VIPVCELGGAVGGVVMSSLLAVVFATFTVYVCVRGLIFVYCTLFHVAFSNKVLMLLRAPY